MQFSNGAIYDADKNVHEVHDCKLDALDEIVEGAGGQPILVLYNFKHDLQRILKRFPQARGFSGSKDLEDWNKGRIEMLCGHPASMGHGLNMQDGGHIIVWFGPTYSSELYDQANARLDRQGQKHSVLVYRLLSHETMDPDVLGICLSKIDNQGALMRAVRAKVEKIVKKNVA